MNDNHTLFHLFYDFITIYLFLFIFIYLLFVYIMGFVHKHMSTLIVLRLEPSIMVQLMEQD